MAETIAQQLMDLAITRNETVRVGCGTYAEARKLRFRCYNLRRDLRRKSKKLFDPREDSYATSPYDGLELIIEGSDLVIAPAPQLSEFKITLGS